MIPNNEALRPCLPAGRQRAGLPGIVDMIIGSAFFLAIPLRRDRQGGASSRLAREGNNFMVIDPFGRSKIRPSKHGGGIPPTFRQHKNSSTIGLNPTVPHVRGSIRGRWKTHGSVGSSGPIFFFPGTRVHCSGLRMDF